MDEDLNFIKTQNVLIMHMRKHLRDGGANASELLENIVDMFHRY